MEEDRVATRAIDATTDRMRLRWTRHPIPRREHLVDAARAWRSTLPAAGRLELSIERQPKSLTIAEMRVGASDFRAPWWERGAIEPGVLVQGIRLVVAPKRFDFAILPLACVSLHALARRLQRGSMAEESLMIELRALGHAAAAPDLCPGAEVIVPVDDDGGRWVGVVAEVMMKSGRHHVLSLRTFKDRLPGA
jgi:hypothetical protein